MPYHGAKRKKTHTHKPELESYGAGSELLPKSFVLRRGKVERSLKELVDDVRQMMSPHTASKLRERKCACIYAHFMRAQS
jgi:ribosome biogenesis protein SSF1/2